MYFDSRLATCSALQSKDVFKLGVAYMSGSELSKSQELYYAFSTLVGYVGALFIPHACLQLEG